MPTPKSHFAMAEWKARSTLFTVGGWNISRLKDVQEYSLAKNTWRLHSQLPESISGSSVVVLHNVMYNIGGFGSSHSVLWNNLSSDVRLDWK